MSILDNEHTILNQTDKNLLKAFADKFISNHINKYEEFSPIEYHKCEYDIEGRPIYGTYRFSPVRYIIYENKIVMIKPIIKNLPILIQNYPFSLPDFVYFDCPDIFTIGCPKLMFKKF